jgi:hypothetical protein
VFIKNFGGLQEVQVLAVVMQFRQEEELHDWHVKVLEGR